MVCIDPLDVNTPFLAHKPTGLYFSCSGMSSGTGTAAGLGLVRENSFGWVVFTGAFFIWFPDDMTASWPMRRSISGRHLKVQQTSVFQFGPEEQFSPRRHRSWTNSPEQRENPLCFHKGSIVNHTPLFLYHCCQVCEEENQELYPKSVTVLLITLYFYNNNVVNYVLDTLH